MPVPQGDPSALERLAAELDEHASDMDGLASSTARTTADIKTNADWTGSAADAYTGFTTNLTHGVGGVQAPLSKMASSVRGYAGYLRTAQEKVSEYNSAAQTAASTGHPAHVTAAKAADQDAQSAVAEANAAGNQAAKEVSEAKDEMENPFGPDGPVREWIEKLHAPWDVLAADLPLGRVISGRIQDYVEGAEEVRENLEELPGLLKKSYAELEGSMQESGANVAELDEETLGLLKVMHGTEKLDAAWLEDAARATRFTNVLRGVGVGSDAAAIVGDYFTLRKPEDDGAMGVVDRSMAGANAVAAGVDGSYLIAGMVVGSTAEIPVAGEVVLVGTGIYLGGDYLYHHWTPFRNVVNDVGHATVATADAVGHVATSAAKGAWHGITSIFG